MGKMDPRAVISALKDLLGRAKQSKDPVAIQEALKTKEIVRSLKNKVKGAG